MAVGGAHNLLLHMTHNRNTCRETPQLEIKAGAYPSTVKWMSAAVYTTTPASTPACTRSRLGAKTNAAPQYIAVTCIRRRQATVRAAGCALSMLAQERAEGS